MYPSTLFVSVPNILRTLYHLPTFLPSTQQMKVQVQKNAGSKYNIVADEAGYHSCRLPFGPVSLSSLTFFSLAPSDNLSLQSQAAGPRPSRTKGQVPAGWILSSQQRDWQKGGSTPLYKALKKGKKELGEHDQIVEPIKEEAVLAGEVFAVVQVVGAVPLVDGAVWLGF